jgi:predicted RNase H-like HicB family nuclease
MSQAAKYEIILYWSAPDDAFIAEVPELPGCMADAAPIKTLCRMSKSSLAMD